ncbi:MAG: VOC family protein [Solirubrobacterales bacterium]
MLGGSDLAPFLATTDLDRAREFFGDTLGMEVVSQNPSVCVFAAPNGSLRVTRVESVDPQHYTVLGWWVDDIATTIDGLTERGIAFERYAGFEQDERGVWQAPSGALIAWFKDPDGNMLSLGQDSGD